MSLFYFDGFIIYNISMKNSKVILNNRVYEASIHNWGYPNFKLRPIIVIKQSKYKALAIQLTTSNPKPKNISDKLNKETNGKLEGVYLKTSHWIKKSAIRGTFLYGDEPIDISKDLSNSMLTELKESRKLKIRSLKEKINQYIEIYVKTNDKKYLKYCKNKLREWKHYDLNNSCPKKWDLWINNKINIIKSKKPKASN